MKTYEIQLTDEQVETVLNSFNAQKIRIKGNVDEAKKRKAQGEVDRWAEIQALSDATAEAIRDQTGRSEVNRKGE